jgi:hypothetical protein
LPLRRGANFGRAGLLGFMVQLISREGAIVAVACTTRFHLAPDVARRPPGDEVRRLVVLMCAYAHRVSVGTVPGPYSDERAELWARVALELIETDTVSV